MRVDYRVRLALRMLTSRKGSMIGAILAITVGILVIHVNFVIFQGLYDAFVRDMKAYRFGDIYVTNEEDYIDKSDALLVGWFERIPQVSAAAPRLSSSASINATGTGMRYEEFGIPIIGVDPRYDTRASAMHETVTQGQYVTSRSSMVLGATVARDLGDVQVGDNIRVKIVDRWGIDQFRRFSVSGISESAGGAGFDTSVIMHIETLRDIIDRGGESGSMIVRLNEPTAAANVRDLFLAAFPADDFKAETIEESAESQLAGFRSGIAMINMIGLFGMMSAAFAIVTIQMMIVGGKTREIGIMRAIGARRKDILVIFIVQGMLMGVMGAAAGTAVGLGYTMYAKETKMTFSGSVALEVSYNWPAIARTALLAFGLSVAASMYPSYRATKLLPVEAMRYV